MCEETSADDLIAQLGRKALLIEGKNELRDPRNFQSLIWGVTHLLPSQKWPANQAGKALYPVCQLDFRDFIDPPEVFQGLEGAALFVEYEGSGSLGLRPGEGWEIYPFAEVGQLEPIFQPSFPGDQNEQIAIEWGMVQVEMPECGYYLDERDQHMDAFWEMIDREDYDREDFCAFKVKLGGYPRGVQWPVHFGDTRPDPEQIKTHGFSYFDENIPNPAQPQLVFQLASMHEIGFYWGDMGAVYIGRGTGKYSDQWFLRHGCG